MRHRIVSARSAAKTFGAVLDAANAAPVIVERHGRPRAAIVGWALFEEYRKAYEAALEERRIEFLELSLKAVEEGRLGKGARALALAARLREAGPAGVNGQPAEGSPE